jgi:hypothetical protein
MPYRINKRNFKRTKVLEVSKKSPLEILVFIEKHWFDILLFLLSTNTRTIFINVEQLIKDFDRLMNSIEDKFVELTEDFSDFEREEIFKFIRWFDNLTEKQKYHINQLIKRSQGVMNKIRKIFKK